MKLFSKYLLLFPLLCLVLILQAAAQQETADRQGLVFKGVVVDAYNTPLPGVTVFVQEKAGQIQTNIKGEFSIKGSINDVLTLKMSGYLTGQQLLSNSNSLRITLQAAPADAGEEDNVAIPFGTRKKRQVSAAVTVTNSRDIPQLPTGDLRNLFSGRVSGLYQAQVGTAPGTTVTTVMVRSINSLAANNARIFVDGTERDYGDMDISEVESVTVLKDAATLAWYGLRGGNGVVMVTTKKGDPTRSYIHFDAQVGVQRAADLIRPRSGLR